MTIKDLINLSMKTFDGFKMSEKSIIESFFKKEENYGFLPEFNLSFISEIKSQMNSIIKQQTQMTIAINSMVNEKISLIQENSYI